MLLLTLYDMTKYFKEDPYLFNEETIDIVPFYYKHIETSPCIHIRLVFDYGAMHDEIGLEGTAHFLEHMILKGCDLIEDEKAYREFVKQYTLGTSNAGTSMYNLQITGKCLPEDVEKVLNTYFSMIITPKFSPEPVEDEKKVITQEIWRFYKNELYLNYIKKTRENNTYDFPEILRVGRALGWVESVQKITPEILRGVREKFLVKNNLKIFVAGNLDKINIVKNVIEKNLEKMKIGEKSQSPNIPTAISYPKEKILENKYIDIGLGDEEQAGIEAEIMLPKFNPSTDLNKIAALRLLSVVMNELVLDKLRVENKLCYSANAGTGSSVTFQNLYIVSKLNSEYIDQAVFLIKEIIEGASAGIYEDKFNSNKELIIKRFISSERVTADILDGAVNSYIGYNQNLLLNDLIEEMEKVTYKDIVDFAKEYLPLDRFVFEILKPKNTK